MRRLGTIMVLVILFIAIAGTVQGNATEPTHIYELDGNFLDELGGPALIPNGSGYLVDGGYMVPDHGSGLSLRNAINPSNYSIEMLVRLDGYPSPEQCVSGDHVCSSKIIDFKDMSTDDGLYTPSGGDASDGRLQICCSLYYDSPEGTIIYGDLIHLVLTRDESTDQVTGYVNGLPVVSVEDSIDLAVFATPDNVVHFLMDDVSFVDDPPIGFIARMRIYEDALTPEEVLTLSVLESEVEIDIKPGIEPNNLYCSRGELVRRGVFDVAILTTDSFDATTVDHTTVTFEGASEIHFDQSTGVPRRHEVDVDHDGDIDLRFHFRLGDTDLSCDSTEGVLIGETFDGIAIQGTDSVRMVNYGRTETCGSTPDSAGVSCQDIRDRCPGTTSGEKWIAPDGTTAILAYCHMDEEGNGWTLIYNRNNAYFSPDHMYHELPAQGPDFSTNSTSWFIPNDATRWRWEVSVDDGASYRMLETSIPPEARTTTHATVENALIGTVYENTTGASGPFFFQTIVFSDRCRYSCHSGSASWWGIVNVSQGAGDQENPGLGGHTDSCSMDSMLLPGDNYTWGDGNLEYYLSDWKDIGGDGIGGTNCNPFFPTTQYRYRFWAR